MSSVLLVDDHPVVLLAIKVLLEQNQFTIVGEATNGIDALKLIKKLMPDIVIIDLNIPSLDGMKVIERCKALNYKMRFLVLTSQSSEHFINLCMQIGASGYLSKTEGIEAVLTAVKSIQSGYKFFPDISCLYNSYEIKNDSPHSLSLLSVREMMVFQYLASGLTNKEIAKTMLLSSKTVSTYKTRIFQKIKINNIAELIDIARKNGIL
ncbi:response regulator transcription factor [Vibrio metschnikovii]|nr:response regulator transcription factor [Vibrio metschnikovii]